MSRSRLVMALVVAVIAVLGYFGKSAFNPITQEKQHVAGITPEQEVALGLQAAPEMLQQFGGADPNPEAQALVKRVGERLVSRTPQLKVPTDSNSTCSTMPRPSTPLPSPAARLPSPRGCFGS